MVTMGVQMKQTKWLAISIFVLASLLGAEAVSAYMMYGGQYDQPYYPTRNYYMMDYYQNPGYSGGYYNPYSYPYGYYRPAYTYSYMGGYYSNYYNDPNWKYYTLNTFTRGNRYGFY